jgi:hypothetical protein
MTSTVTTSGSTVTTTFSSKSLGAASSGRQPSEGPFVLNSKSVKGDRSIFKTAKPQGSFRDKIVVEVNTIDDEPFRGAVSMVEAVKLIFIKELGFEKSALGSVNIGYSMGRIVKFKLRDKFDIDQLASIEQFSICRQSQKRGGEIIEQKLGCKIRGIQKLRMSTQAPYRGDNTRWVKIEGCKFRVSKDELKDWMAKLGNVLSEITENRINLDSDTNEDSGAERSSIGTGTYSVKMQLNADLPQFVPICGKRIRLYYRGIPKMCTNCFGPHIRKVCSSSRVQWIEYVQ